jgi:hypothetical protein
LERHNAVAKSIGAPAVERQSRNLFPVTGMTDGTAAELARQDRQAAKAPPPNQAGAKAPPPSVVVPPQGSPANRARDPAAFTPPAPATTGEVVVDESAIDKLNAVWRGMSPEQRDATRAQYQAELAEFFDGRKLAESRDAFYVRTGKSKV